MICHDVRFATAVLAAAALLSCAPAPTPADAGFDDAGAAADDDAGLTADAGFDGDAGAEDEGPTGKGLIVWDEGLPNPYLLPGPDDEDGVLDEIGIDFFLQFHATLPEGESSIEYRRCEQRATWTELACSTELWPGAAEGGVRWGLDPSQWETGFNVYSHRVRLLQGDVVLDGTTLRFEVNAP